MAWARVRCHRAKWLRSLTEKPDLNSASGGNAAGWGGFCCFHLFWILQGELQDGAAVPTQRPSPLLLFSPSLPFKRRKTDLLTNGCREGKGRRSCLLPPQASPRPLPCSGPLRDMGLGKAEAGGVGVAAEPSCQRASTWDSCRSLGSGRRRTRGLMEPGGVGRAGDPLIHIHVHILTRWQLVAGPCLSQGHAKVQPCEGVSELRLLLTRAKGLGASGVVGDDDIVVGRGQKPRGWKGAGAWAGSVSKGLLKV